jgi:hypothetical protein
VGLRRALPKPLVALRHREALRVCVGGHPHCCADSCGGGDQRYGQAACWPTG